MTPYRNHARESQERMLLVARKGSASRSAGRFQKVGTGRLRRRTVITRAASRHQNHGAVAVQIPAHPLAEEGPVYIARSRASAARRIRKRLVHPRAGRHEPNRKFQKTSRVLPRSPPKRWITEQYDTSVRTNTLAGPGVSDAAIVRIKESEKDGPDGKKTMRGLALATDGNGRWCQLNPRIGAMHAVAEAARNVATSGARPIAATNCLNFGKPRKAGSHVAIFPKPSTESAKPAPRSARLSPAATSASTTRTLGKIHLSHTGHRHSRNPRRFFQSPQNRFRNPATLFCCWMDRAQTNLQP